MRYGLPRGPSSAYGRIRPNYTRFSRLHPRQSVDFYEIRLSEMGQWGKSNSYSPRSTSKYGKGAY